MPPKTEALLIAHAQNDVRKLQRWFNDAYLPTYAFHLGGDKAPSLADQFLFYQHLPTQADAEHRFLSQLALLFEDHYASHTKNPVIYPEATLLHFNTGSAAHKWLQLLLGAPILYRKFPKSIDQRKFLLREIFNVLFRAQLRERKHVSKPIEYIHPAEHYLPLLTHLYTDYPHLEPKLQARLALFDTARGNLANILTQYILLTTATRTLPDVQEIKDYLAQIRLAEFRVEPLRIVQLLKAALPRHNVVQILSDPLLELCGHANVPLHEGIDLILRKTE